MTGLSTDELLKIAAEAHVFKIMGESRTQRVKLDYVPARPAMIIPRLPDEPDPINVYPAESIEVTFTLEDAMFGGVIYVALLAQGRIIIHPFQWTSYDDLAGKAIPTR